MGDKRLSVAETWDVLDEDGFRQLLDGGPAALGDAAPDGTTPDADAADQHSADQGSARHNTPDDTTVEESA